MEGYLGAMPETTLLVFADGPLGRRNPLLERLRPLAQVREMPTPVGEGLARWVREAAAAQGGSIAPGAIRLLCQLVGPNLWVLDRELCKLALYAGDAPISEVHVRALVSQAREATVFDVVDSLLEGRQATAYRSMVRLRQEGADFSYIVAMVARQLRQVVLAKEILTRGSGEREVGQRLQIPAEFVVKKTVAQARRHSRQGLAQMYQELLEADLAVKLGRMDEDLALHQLVRQAVPRR